MKIIIASTENRQHLVEIVLATSMTYRTVYRTRFSPAQAEPRHRWVAHQHPDRALLDWAAAGGAVPNSDTQARLVSLYHYCRNYRRV